LTTGRRVRDRIVPAIAGKKGAAMQIMAADRDASFFLRAGSA
jgi:hypothetical protein